MMANVRQRDTDAQSISSSQSWPARGASLRAGSSRPFIGLPARPDSTLIRSPDSDGPLNSAATAGTLTSHNESASPRAETSHRPRPVPRLSISSEDGETVDVDDIGSIAVQSSRHDLHASLPSATAPQAHQTVEVAMEIAEEVSRVCDFCLPLTTDAPLASAGLKRSTAKQMVAWLDARFDYEASTIQLLDENVTAEVLAAEIIAQSPTACPSQERPPSPVTQRSTRVRESSSDESRRLSPVSSARRARRKDLSISVVSLVDEAQNNDWIQALSPSSSSVDLPLRHSPVLQPARGLRSLRKDGKKSGGLMLGLLTVGAIMGSPLTVQFDRPGSGTVQNFNPVSVHSPGISSSVYASSPQASARFRSRSVNALGYPVASPNPLQTGRDPQLWLPGSAPVA